MIWMVGDKKKNVGKHNVKRDGTKIDCKQMLREYRKIVGWGLENGKQGVGKKINEQIEKRLMFDQMINDTQLKNDYVLKSIPS